MINKLCHIKSAASVNGAQIPLFYGSYFTGGEVVLCIKEGWVYYQVFYCGQVFKVAKEYLTVWVQ